MSALGSAGYVGGIGTMLAQSEVCPMCGSIHAAPKLSLRYLLGPSCPSVVVGAMPAYAPDQVRVVRESAEPEEEPAVYPGSIPISRPVARRANSPGVSWPLPTDWEDYP